MGDTISLIFSDQWFWILFVVLGLIMVLLELIFDISTGLDLVFIGSAFIVGGLVTWPLHSWILTIIVTSVICIAYIFLGRKYVHRMTAVKKYQTNVDALIGKVGIVTREIAKNADGNVKVGNEEWRARAEGPIGPGEEIVVTGIQGVTLIVEKEKGGTV